MPKTICRTVGCRELVSYREFFCRKCREKRGGASSGGGKKDTRKSSAERGYDASWRRLRNTFLSFYPLCQKCGLIASVVHHIKPIKTHPDLRLDWDNLMPMCRECHEKIEGRNKWR